MWRYRCNYDFYVHRRICRGLLTASALQKYTYPGGDGWGAGNDLQRPVGKSEPCQKYDQSVRPTNSLHVHIISYHCRSNTNVTFGCALLNSRHPFLVESGRNRGHGNCFGWQSVRVRVWGVAGRNPLMPATDRPNLPHLRGLNNKQALHSLK
jgi:hypothetical protein